MVSGKNVELTVQTVRRMINFDDEAAIADFVEAYQMKDGFIW